MTLYAADAVPATPSASQISTLYGQRRAARGPELARMAEVQQLYDGDIVVPLPELNTQERSSLPNRTREGLKQFSQRIASAPPSLWCPPARPGFKGSEDSAHARRRAILGWWGASKLRLVMRQRARYLQGYGVSPAQVRWDPKLQLPRYEHRNPLMTFPSHLRGPEDMCPANCIFETTQALWWLQQNYPAAALFVAKPRECKPDQLFTILEYADADVCVLVVLGIKDHDQFAPTVVEGSMAVELERYPNRSGRCPVVIPRQISLSKPHGQFDGLLGMYQTEALLTAMTIIATRNGVFGEDWLVSAPNTTAEIVQQPDIAEGIPGIIKDGALQRLGTEPQFQQNNAIDRLAAAQNQQAGITSELQGVAGSNIRTGARASTLLSNVIDFPIQEAQELFAESLQEENRIAVAFAKAYGDGPKSFYVDWDGARGPVTYDPKAAFETDENRVWYPLSGADQAGMIISGGQRVGMGTLSKKSFMRIDPLVEDPELEHDAIIGEQLEEAMVMAIKQQAAGGMIPPTSVGRIAALVLSDKVELYEAIDTAHEEAQKLQATPAPAGSPETQPGIAQPGAGAEQPSVGPTPDSQGLASLLSSLRAPQRSLPAERVAG